MKQSRRHSVRARRALAASALLLSTSLATAAWAADAGGLQLEEIIVTATKTGETALQSTPLAITAFSGEQLASRGVTGVRGLVDYTPGLQIADQSGYAQLYIRGIGSNNVFVGSDPSSTTHMDGVYLARPLSYFSDFLDVERVEVLRGPQGTIYGRNSVGGTINIISRKPSETFTGEAQVYYGNYNAYGLKGYVSGPVGDTGVRFSLAANRMARDAYYENVSTGNDIGNQNAFGVRGQVLLPLGERGDFTLRADYAKSSDAMGTYSKLLQPIGNPLDDAILTDYGKFSADLDNHTTLQNFGAAAEINYELTDNLALKSLTAARSVKGSIETDADATSLNLFRTLIAPIMQRQYSQELNLTGKFDNLTFVTGAYYFQENVREPLNLALPGFGVSHFQRPRLKAESYAFFGQAEYQITPEISVVAGVRYSKETKDYFLRDFWTVSSSFDIAQAEAAPTIGAPFFSDPFIVNTSRGDNAWTPKFGLNYKPTDDLLLYASATRGFKNGGFEYGATNAVDAARGYAPEYLWAYEVGMKSDWFDNRLRLNLAGFYYDYKDLQVTLFTPPANAITDNAATAKVKGLEAEIQARVVQGLDVFANLAYLDATYSSYPGATVTAFGPFDAKGKRLNSSPEFSMTLGGVYTHELGDNGTVYAGVDYHWQSTIYFTPANAGVGAVTNYAERQSGYGLWNARVGWDSPESQWGFAIIGRNLANKGYVTGTVNYTPNIAGRVGAPRTAIAQLSFKY